MRGMTQAGFDAGVLLHEQFSNSPSRESRAEQVALDLVDVGVCRDEVSPHLCLEFP
jgi:hypothetical protein